MLGALAALRRLRRVSLATLVLAGPAVVAQEGAPARRALVVAVADYPQPLIPGRRAYSRLAGPRNDADSLVAPALRRQGFEVETLYDDEATREGMLAALDRLAASARPGDLVFIHYSGHGHQVTDASGDEPDGYDEVLVPYGAPLDPEGDYAGEQHLTDDELGAVVADLRRRVYPGGEVVVTFDACHSGSATRGE
ncbi:MAG: caspase family protein, partial [Rubricoccaceae bacterium]|nr:caspase family protein [Rubricoccaceae bacterium]